MPQALHWAREWREWIHPAQPRKHLGRDESGIDGEEDVRGSGIVRATVSVYIRWYFKVIIRR